MADCELIGICIFFNGKMKSRPVATERLKAQYCRGDNAGCARYVVYRALGISGVPETLLPGEKARARRILEDYG